MVHFDVYPLPMKHTKVLNSDIFRYIWNSNSDPLKRNTLYKKKDEGGIGLLDIHTKAKSLFVTTTIKVFLKSEGNSMKYYLANNVNDIFGLKVINTNVCNRNAPYYE